MNQQLCILNDPTNGEFEPAHYFSAWDYHLAEIDYERGPAQVAELAGWGFDIFLNLCDGTASEQRPGIEIVQALASQNLAYTGADEAFYDPSRFAMKAACLAEGICFPAAFLIESLDKVKEQASDLGFPLLVKHPNSSGSIGLLPESRVETPADLQKQASRMMENYGVLPLVEEFIEGREFSVLVAENPNAAGSPVAFQPVEFTFPPGDSFKHEALKWVRYEEMTCRPVTDSHLDARLRDLATRLFRRMNGCGYGRCDIRMAGSGELHLLEINPNCGIFYPPDGPGTADLILQFDPRGHAGFIELIFAAAKKRVNSL